MNTVIKRAWNKNKLVKVEDLTGMTFQAESGGHTFEISGVDDTGAAVSLSGTVEGRFLRADNAGIIISGTVSGGKASVTLSAACYAIPGRFLLTIYVTSGGQKVAVYAATGSVVATSGTASGSIPPLVTDSVQANTGTFGSISTGDATVDGVLDVTSRRCYFVTSGSKWLRVLAYESMSSTDALMFGASTVHIDIDVNRNSETHTVTLRPSGSGGPRFIGETSNNNGSALIVEKIRYSRADDDSAAYIDIYFNSADVTYVGVTFDISTPLQRQSKYSASSGLVEVSASPVGETVMREYSFSETGSWLDSLNAIGIEQVNIVANTSKTFRVENSTANAFLVVGSSQNLRTIILVYSTSAGVISYTMSPSVSGITVTTDTNTITLSSSYYVRIARFIF